MISHPGRLLIILGKSFLKYLRRPEIGKYRKIGTAWVLFGIISKKIQGKTVRAFNIII